MLRKLAMTLLPLFFAATSNAGTSIVKIKAPSTPAPQAASTKPESTAKNKAKPAKPTMVKPVAKNKDIAVLQANVMYEIVGALASNVEVMRSTSSNLEVRIEGKNNVVPTFVKMHSSCYQVVETPEHQEQRKLDKTELFSQGQTFWLPSEEFSLEPSSDCPVLKKKTKEPVLFYQANGKTFSLSFKFKEVKEFAPIIPK